MLNDPKTLGLALLFGLIPSLIWLWFWLREDKKKSEPKGLMTICFIAGMIAVICVIPIQKFIRSTIGSESLQVIGWAAAEELLKYLFVLLVLWKTTKIDEPMEWPIYMITGALGFAALENTLFFVEPISLNETTVGILTGHLRFLGSTLLHSIASGIIGIAMGLSIYMSKGRKKIYTFVGILLAITLHSLFNFFIIYNSEGGFLKVFGFLWVVTIIVMLLFEKIRRMPIVKTEESS